MELEKARLTGAQETTLATLYGKAMESRRPDSIFSHREADKALRRIDYDFSRLRVRRSDHLSLAVRAKAYDGRARYSSPAIPTVPCCTSAAVWTPGSIESTRRPPFAGTKSTFPTLSSCGGGSFRRGTVRRPSPHR